MGVFSVLSYVYKHISVYVHACNHAHSTKLPPSNFFFLLIVQTQHFPAYYIAIIICKKSPIIAGNCRPQALSLN